MYPVLRGVMRLLARLVLGRRLHVEGLANVPRHGGVLLVGNHVGAIDPPLTGALLPRLDVHYMAKDEHFRRPLNRAVFRGYNAFPVVRHSADRAALRHTLRLLSEGHAVLLYPEGSRSPDGHMRAPEPGAGFLARHAGVPVIPVAIWGSEKALPRGSRRPRRADVHIRYGTPVSLPAVAPGGRADNAAAARAVMEAIAAMLPPEYAPLPEPAAAATVAPREP
ncbi:MAG: lysophospholipid acyltransferase family protein [Candidatus Dormibacteria bacterium]